jgi:hypothetical protein
VLLISAAFHFFSTYFLERTPSDGHLDVKNGCWARRNHLIDEGFDPTEFDYAAADIAALLLSRDISLYLIK